MFAKAGVDLTSTLPNLRPRRDHHRVVHGVGHGRRERGRRLSRSTSRSGAPPARRTPPTGWRSTSARRARWTSCGCTSATTGPTNRYRQPASYQVQYWNGSAFVNAGVAGEDAGVAAGELQPGAVRVGQHAADPGAGDARVRVQDRADRGAGVRPRRRSRDPDPDGRSTRRGRRPRRRPTPRRGSRCAALNDGIDPPSSNDTVNPRWGTWPNTGEQWAELTWCVGADAERGRRVLLRRQRGRAAAGVVPAAVLERIVLCGRRGASGYPLAVNQYNRVTFTAGQHDAVARGAAERRRLGRTARGQGLRAVRPCGEGAPGALPALVAAPVSVKGFHHASVAPDPAPNRRRRRRGVPPRPSALGAPASRGPRRHRRLRLRRSR